MAAKRELKPESKRGEIGELRFLRTLVRDLMKQNAELQRMLARRENLLPPAPYDDSLPPRLPLEELAQPVPTTSFVDFDVLAEQPEPDSRGGGSSGGAS